jgi:hypothetical protein
MTDINKNNATITILKLTVKNLYEKLLLPVRFQFKIYLN